MYSFVKVAKFLLKQSSGLYLLSEKFSQDPLESFFGQQRARGGRSDNPNVRNFFCTMPRPLEYNDPWSLDTMEMSRNAHLIQMMMNGTAPRKNAIDYPKNQ